MTVWRSCIVESQKETLEEKMEKIREKAYRLKEQRERERQNFVLDCYSRQWKDSCDDARRIENRARVKQLSTDREQLQKFVQSEANEETKEAHLTSLPLWSDENAEDRDRLCKNLEMREALDLQVKVNKERDKQKRLCLQNEEQKLLQQWKDDIMYEQQREEKLIAAARAQGVEAMKTNEMRQEILKRQQHEELQKDLTLLDYAMKIEQDEIQKELDEKERSQEETRDYMKFLRQQMIRESIDTGDLDLIHAEECRKIQDERDAKLKAQIDARARLLKDVQKGRLLQMEQKRQKLEEEKINDMQEFADRMVQDAKINEEERKRSHEAKQQTLVVNDYIRKQIEQKQGLRGCKQQQNYLLSKLMHYEEGKYMNKLKQVRDI